MNYQDWLKERRKQLTEEGFYKRLFEEDEAQGCK